MSNDAKPIPPELRDLLQEIRTFMEQDFPQIKNTKQRVRSLAERISEFEELLKCLNEKISVIDTELKQEREDRHREIRALKDDQSHFGAVAGKVEIAEIKSELKSLRSRIDKLEQG